MASADYAVAITENWQSEYLQFLLYILLTVWLVQRGSAESSTPDTGLESDRKQRLGRHTEPGSPRWPKAGALRTAVYSWSLPTMMGLVFVVSWLVQSVAGWASYNQVRLQDLQDPLSWSAYLANADFWERSLKNWQSEFLAIGSMAVFKHPPAATGLPGEQAGGRPHDRTGGSG